MNTEETYCTTCGAFDSMLQTDDNACCRECGDTEGLVHSDRYDVQEWNDLLRKYGAA